MLAPPESRLGWSATDPDLEVHIAARTVLEHCPQPLNELEVAVVLETAGFSPSRVRTCGFEDLMSLARAVYALVALYGEPGVAAGGGIEGGAGALGPPWQRAGRAAASFLEGLLFAAPLLVSLVTVVVADVSFFSSRAQLPSVATDVTLSSCAALITTGPFVFAFSRRASFYLPFKDDAMLAHVARRVLGPALVTAAAFVTAIYLLRLAGTPPAAGRLGLAGGIVVAAMQVGFAPLYLRRAVLPVLAIMAAGGAALIWQVVHAGPFIDPVALATWQVRLLAVMCAATWLMDAWWALRAGPRRGQGAPRRIWSPSRSGFLRATGPYAAFGLGYFCLVALPQLLSGGPLTSYQFNPSYSVASGVGVLVLVPVAGFGNMVSEHLAKQFVPTLLQRYRVEDLATARGAMAKFWRTRLVAATSLSFASAALLAAVLPAVSHGWPGAPWVAARPGLLYECCGGFAALAVGTFSCQVLFGTGCPAQPVVAALAGALALVVSGLVALFACHANYTTLAVTAFVAGSCVFALVGVVAGGSAFRKVDLACYRAF